MMSERRILKGRLTELEDRKKQLEIKMRSNCERIGVIINPLINDLAEMAIPESAQLMDELVMQQAELLNVSGKISAIKEELYG